MPKEQILDVFPALNFEEAWDYNRDQIVAYLEKAIENTQASGLNDKANLLRVIKSEIINLSLPDGPNYLSPVPKQHIYRSYDPGWIDPPPKGVSRFVVQRYLHAKDPEHNFPYWSPYDLLGLFLSLIGSAPPAASKRNSYLPWTALYGRWCCKIGKGRTVGEDGKEEDGFRHPAIFQCTWYKKDGEVDKFFLGASSAGFDHKANVGDWMDVVQRARFNVLIDNFLELREDKDKSGNPWTFETSPKGENQPEGMGNPFGICGETYPFLNQFIGFSPTEAEKCFGLALKITFIKDDKYQYWTNGIWKHLSGPCPNCQKLIKLGGGKKENFSMKNGQQGAPKEEDTSGAAITSSARYFRYKGLEK